MVDVDAPQGENIASWVRLCTLAVRNMPSSLIAGRWVAEHSLSPVVCSTAIAESVESHFPSWRMKLSTLMAYLFLGLVSMLVLLNGWMYLQQPSMVFFPVKALESNPGDWGYAYEDVVLTTTDDVSLHAWYIPHQGATRTVLILHGNAGNISHRRETVAIFHEFGLNVLIPDYRGYGRSEGTPDETGLYRDAMAAWTYLINERGQHPAGVILFGRSLGGAVAAQLATRVRPAGLILESTFTSAAAMAHEVLPLLSRAIWLRYRFDTLGRIDRIECPLLLLHSPQDDVIPFEMGESLYRRAGSPVRFVRLQGNHNTGFLLSQPGYGRALAEFIQRVTEPDDSRKVKD